jgi:hypothetical protein
MLSNGNASRSSPRRASEASSTAPRAHCTRGVSYKALQVRIGQILSTGFKKPEMPGAPDGGALRLTARSGWLTAGLRFLEPAPQHSPDCRYLRVW